MPGKKGSRVAASQARAKAAAKKKSRSSGPDLATAARATPIDAREDETEVLSEAEDSPYQIARSNRSAATEAAVRTSSRRSATRRERQAFGAISAGSLKREVMTIGFIASLAGVALATVKLATDLGR